MPSRHFAFVTIAERRGSTSASSVSACAPTTRKHATTREEHAASIARWTRTRPSNSDVSLSPPNRSPAPAARMTAATVRRTATLDGVLLTQHLEHRVVYEAV